ncbi:MAG: glycosyltransferase family 39 protein, partial [Nitrospinota bacterium]|nr:glycosyltransferase family 39 protein [Nitrospinota bacterium]
MRYPRPGVHGLWLAAIILAGGAIRLIYIGEKSLWYDEALSFWFSSLPLAELWGVAPGYETHPPLYYTLLKGWRGLFGASEGGMRSLSALAGTATIPVIYWLGRIAAGEARGRAAGLASAAIFAITPIHIVYSQEARPYALLVLWAMLALLGALWLTANPLRAARPYLGLGGGADEKIDREAAQAWAALALGAALTLWLHNMGFTLTLALLATGAAGLLWKTDFSRPYMLNVALAAGVILLIYSPFIPWFIKQSGNVHTSFWLQSINLGLIGRRLDEVFFLYLPSPWQKGVLLGLAIYGLVVTKRARGLLPMVTIAGAMIIPLVLVIGLSYLFTPIFVARTMIWTSGPFLVAAGVGLAALLEGRPLAPSAVVALVVLAALAPGVWKHFQGHKEPWRQMTRLVGEKAMPGDVALALPNSAAIPFSYYAARYIPDMKIISLPASFPAKGLARPYPTGNMAEPGFTEADLHLLDGINCDGHSIWFVARFLPMFDPNKIVFNTLSEKCEMVESGGNMSLKI